MLTWNTGFAVKKNDCFLLSDFDEGDTKLTLDAEEDLEQYISMRRQMDALEAAIVALRTQGDFENVGELEELWNMIKEGADGSLCIIKAFYMTENTEER